MFRVNFHTQMKPVILILVGGAYVTDTIFLWKDVPSYVGHHGIFTGISEPQDSYKVLSTWKKYLNNFLIRTFSKNCG